MSQKRIVIIDDHTLIRSGIRVLLEARQHAGHRFEIVAEAADGVDGWQAIQRCQPDLVLLDINMPRLDGYQVLDRVAGMAQRPKVLVLSAYCGPLPVARALDAGANGVVYKVEAEDVLCRAIDAVMAGFRFVPCDATRTLAMRGVHGLARLSTRERSVADGLMQGCTNKAIANRLCLSAKTVSTHKRNILRKLSVNNVIELIDCLRHTDSYGIDAAGMSEAKSIATMPETEGIYGVASQKCLPTEALV